MNPADDLVALEERWTVFRLGTPMARQSIDQATLSRFRAHGARNAKAAHAAERFLTEQARDDPTTYTRVFTDDGEIAGFYSLSVGEAELRSRDRHRFGRRGISERVPTAHVDWIARGEDAPRGTGLAMLKHALSIIDRDLQPIVPVMALSLDPFDSLTAEVWARAGFRKTKTEVDGTGLSRMFFPLSGYGQTGLTEDRLSRRA